MTWWPGPGWAPWDDLVEAGVRVIDDPRNLAPPCVLFGIDSATSELAAAEGCLSVDIVAKATAIPPGPDHADARRWLWTVAVPPLMIHADARGALQTTYEDTELVCVEVFLPVITTYAVAPLRRLSHAR